MDVCDKLSEGIVEARARIVKDRRTLPEEQMAVSPGGNDRSGADSADEMAFVNRRMVARLRVERRASREGQ